MAEIIYAKRDNRNSEIDNEKSNIIENHIFDVKIENLNSILKKQSRLEVTPLSLLLFFCSNDLVMTIHFFHNGNSNAIETIIFEK